MLFSPSSARADTAHGPKLIVGAPQRHTLVSCGTNTAEALTCIQSVAVTNKSGQKPIVGKLTGKKIRSEFDGRIGDSERPVAASTATPESISKLEVKVMISNEECCHNPNVGMYLQRYKNGNWETITTKLDFYAKDPAAFTSGVPSVNAATVFTVAEAQQLFQEVPSSWSMNSQKIVYAGNQLRFKLDGGSWNWYSTAEVSLTPFNNAPTPRVNPGNYEEWTFPNPTTPNTPSGSIVVYSDFQPYQATWCWTIESCSANREEYTLYLKSSNGPEAWKGNKEIAFTVTIRAPKTFAIGEVSGSAQNTVVKYGKDLPDFKGVAMREIVATLSPIATARSRQLAGSPPEETAYGYTYDANLNIFGMHNDITDFLGPCAKKGGVQVISNAMHSIDPVWDAATETIKVRLETPHFAPDGTLNTGYLEIRVPKETALCMWGFSLDGNIKAAVSITYDDGSTPSLVTVVGKVIENDYLIITSGFHFSSPNLAIKITHSTDTSEASATAVIKPLVTPSPKATLSSTAVKTSITCINGKTVKKVSGLKPTCPAGYKKK